jgi:GTPase SAR1 family protein
MCDWQPLCQENFNPDEDRRLSRLYSTDQPEARGSTMLIPQSIEGREASFYLRDISRDETYCRLVRICIRKSQLVVLVFDLMRTSSFVAIDNWIMSVKNEAENAAHFLLVDRKRDLEGKLEITISQIFEKCQKMGTFDCVEMSALNCLGNHIMIDDGVPESKKRLKNEPKAKKKEETADLRI